MSGVCYAATECWVFPSEHIHKKIFKKKCLDKSCKELRVVMSALNFKVRNIVTGEFHLIVIR